MNSEASSAHQACGDAAKLQVAEFVVDFDGEQLLDARGALVELRPQAWAVLRHLALNAGRLVTRSELLETVWPGLVVTDGSLSQAISDLREALEDTGHRTIRTVPKRGYMLVAGGLEPPHGMPERPVPSGSPGWPAIGTVAREGDPPSPASGRDERGEYGPFVGRGREFDLLRALLSNTRCDTGHVGLIEGEPGIGKSRLLDELAAFAARHQSAILVTRCYEIERGVAYQPVIDLLTQAVRLASPGMLQSLGHVSLGEIAALVPQLREQVGVPFLSSDFPEARLARLFRAIVQLLDLIASTQRLVAIVDDIQWVDDASLQFLHYLARQAGQRSLLVLFAFRDEDVYDDERLRAFISSVKAVGHARHVQLGRLSLRDTRALLDRTDDPALVERLHRETEGNPFFLISMLQAVREGGVSLEEAAELPLPDALRAAVSARLSHVPVEARSTLEVAAVLGRHFDSDILLKVTGEPEKQVLRALEILTARRLLREQAGKGTYDFSHDKVREVAYLQICSARRMLLHRAVAGVLERAGEDDARLAEHHERGHCWSKALQCMLRAGGQAMQLFAMRDALHWYDRAVTLAQSRREALEGTSMVELYDKRGAARAEAGQTDGAVEDVRRVIESARHRGDRAHARDALIRLGMTYRRADDYASAASALDEALRESLAMGDERHAADTLYHLGTVAWSEGRNRVATTFHERAVAICERLELTDLVAVQAYHGRGESHQNNAEVRPAIACYARSTELARGIGDKSYECENLMATGYAYTGYLGLADYEMASAAFESALGIAQKADLQWHMGPTLLGRDLVRACTGRYGIAWTGMSRTLDWLHGLHLTRYQLMAHDFLAVMLLDLGLHRMALQLLERALAMAEAARISFWLPRLEANWAMAAIRLGRLDVGPRTERARQEALDHGETLHLGRCLETLAELALARGHAQECLAHATRLLDIAEPGGLKEWAASARRWRGEALASRGADEEAAVEFGLAHHMASQMGRVRLAWDAAAGLARLGKPGGETANELARRIRASLDGAGLEARLPTFSPSSPDTAA